MGLKKSIFDVVFVVTNVSAGRLSLDNKLLIMLKYGTIY